MSSDVDLDLDEEGESLWRAVTQSWDDQAAHDRFVQHCFSRGRLAAAGGRYRKVLDAQTQTPDAPASTALLARRMQERVVFLSMSGLVPSSLRAKRVQLMSSPWLVAVILFGAVVGAVLGFALGGRR